MLALLRRAGLPVLALALLASTAFGQARVGDDAPDFTLVDTDGTSHTLSDYQGQVVFLNLVGFG